MPACLPIRGAGFGGLWDEGLPRKTLEGEPMKQKTYSTGDLGWNHESHFWANLATAVLCLIVLGGLVAAVMWL